MTGSYAGLIRQLAEVAAHAEAQRTEAETWYERQCVGAERALRTAQAAVRQAETEVAAAAEEVETVDAEAAHLWQVLGGRLGSGTRRLGSPPGPARGATADPATLLDGVRQLLDRAKQPDELPSSTHPLLALFGILGAAAAYALGLAARLVGDRYGGDLAVGMPVLALVVTLLGPLVGLAPAKLLADRRHAVLGPRPVAVVLIAGLVGTGVLFALLR
ncbi:hypothetical protein GCM10027280_42620 [Micromonospora polyrhachis]|uniref:Uncharacterized protein n=1 Tax=Micromonospora polyrhachis TaxID=1282883 RepID=A0A7W7SW76_9ACTN|nr:hypothetical protein [Micromonospora polyrhachis]MBB4962079.1 hypothetical protein [Micromonospora polyrhachis]